MRMNGKLHTLKVTEEVRYISCLLGKYIHIGNEFQNEPEFRRMRKDAEVN